MFKIGKLCIRISTKYFYDKLGTGILSIFLNNTLFEVIAEFD